VPSSITASRWDTWASPPPVRATSMNSSSMREDSASACPCLVTTVPRTSETTSSMRTPGGSARTGRPRRSASARTSPGTGAGPSVRRKARAEVPIESSRSTRARQLAGSAGGSRAPRTTRTSGPAAASGSAGSSTTMWRTTRPSPAAPAATVVPARPGRSRASSTVRPIRSCQLVRSSRVVSARDSATAQLRRNGTEPLRCVEAANEASPWVTTHPPLCHRPGCHTATSCHLSLDDDPHSWRHPP
jgi:hypothetical protein